MDLIDNSYKEGEIHAQNGKYKLTFIKRSSFKKRVESN